MVRTMPTANPGRVRNSICDRLVIALNRSTRTSAAAAQESNSRDNRTRQVNSSGQMPSSFTIVFKLIVSAIALLLEQRLHARECLLKEGMRALVCHDPCPSRRSIRQDHRGRTSCAPNPGRRAEGNALHRNTRRRPFRCRSHATSERKCMRSQPVCRNLPVSTASTSRPSWRRPT